MSRAVANYAKSRFIKIHGKQMPMTYAMREYKLNHYTLTKNIITRVQGFTGVPSTKHFIEQELRAQYQRHTLAPSRQQILDAKYNKISLKRLAKTCGVTYNVVATLCLLHGIPTTFQQIDPSVHADLTQKKLKSFLARRMSAESIAAQYNVSPSFVLQRIHSFGLTVPKSYTSIGENEVRDFITSLGFTSEKRKTSQYEIDIYIPELSIGIEYNGSYWHSKYTRTYHKEKYLKAHSDGIRLIQIWDIDWAAKKDLIKEKLQHILHATDQDKVFARKCTIRTVSNQDIAPFYAHHHIQGHKPCSWSAVLEYNGRIVAAMSFKQNKLERYATSDHVLGGFSKLLTYAIAQLSLTTVETFADLFWSNHEHNQYNTAGFTFQYITSPNYFWIVDGKKCSRLKFQKHKLTQLPAYDVNKTEAQIMQESGHYRIFDAGHAKFILQV